MRHFISVFVLLIFGLASYGQLLERTDDRGYRNTVKRVHAVGDSAWVTLMDYNGFSQTPAPQTGVQYFDDNGQLLWEIDGGFFYPNHIKEIVMNNNDQLVLFQTDVACDVGQAIPMKIRVVGLNGELISDIDLEAEIDAFDSGVQGCSTDDVIFVTTSYYAQQPYYSQLIALDNEANELWTLLLEYEDIFHIETMAGDAVVFGENELLRVNPQGEKVDSLEYAEAPIAVVSANEKILMLMESGLYELDGNLALNEVASYPVPVVPEKVLFEFDQIHLVYDSAVYIYNESYMIQDTIFYEALPNFSIEAVAMNTDNYFIVGKRSFQTTIRYHFVTESYWTSSAAYLSIPREGEIPSHFPDAALRNLSLSDYTSNNHSANAEFFLINEGNVLIDSVQVNFVAQENSITCGVFGKTKQFHDLMLEPGDSVLLSMDNLSYGYPFSIQPSDSGLVEYCIYVTQPNQLYDRVTDNDQVCGSVDIGVGINEQPIGISRIYPNPAGGHVTIDFSETNESDILQIYDATGKQIEAFSVNRQTQLTLDVADWNVGLYYFRIVSEGKISGPVKVSIVH